MALSENPSVQEIINEVERLNNLIVDRGGERIITPTTTNQILAKGNYKGDITVLGDANLVSGNILSGKSIFGVEGVSNVVKVHKSIYSIKGVTINSGWSHRVPVNFGFVPSFICITCDLYAKVHYNSNPYSDTFEGLSVTSKDSFFMRHMYLSISTNVDDTGFNLYLGSGTYDGYIRFESNLQIIAY